MSTASHPIGAHSAPVTLSDAQEQRRLYTEKPILVATLLGTPLAAGWLMATNYRVLGLQQRARKALLYGVLGFLACEAAKVLLYAALMGITALPSRLLVWSLVTAASLYVVKFLVAEKQGRHIERVLAGGGPPPIVDTRGCRWAGRGGDQLGRCLGPSVGADPARLTPSRLRPLLGPG